MTHQEKIKRVLDLYPELGSTLIISEDMCDLMIEESCAGCEEKFTLNKLTEHGKAYLCPGCLREFHQDMQEPS